MKKKKERTTKELLYHILGYAKHRVFRHSKSGLKKQIGKDELRRVLDEFNKISGKMPKL